MNAVAVAAMTEQEAQKLTERIRLTAVTFAESRTKLMDLVQEAKDGNAHLALGYASWTAYLAEVLGDEPMRLARGERQEMVQMLSAEGMSTRAIAPIVGTTHKTVVKDLQEHLVPEVPREPVQGMDGKTYNRTEAIEVPAPRRSPLPEQYFKAVYDLGKLLDRLERLTEDDRFNRNKQDLNAKHQHDLARHQTKLAGLINKLSN